MATRSTISCLNADGTINLVHCHWDGYIKHNGVLLQERYNNPEQIAKIMDRGNLSVLGKDPETDNPFREINGELCVFYGRDYGEEDEGALMFCSIEDYKGYKRFSQYNYIFINNEWFVFDRICGLDKMESVSKKLDNAKT